ncbi:MAG: hypothetical protein HY904_12220 [Deltaproteobacteria bacterium]|nr:hypothetical protein [Deltaproteobacteria bacterium]
MLILVIVASFAGCPPRKDRQFDEESTLSCGSLQASLPANAWTTALSRLGARGGNARPDRARGCAGRSARPPERRADWVRGDLYAVLQVTEDDVASDVAVVPTLVGPHQRIIQRIIEASLATPTIAALLARELLRHPMVGAQAREAAAEGLQGIAVPVELIEERGALYWFENTRAYAAGRHLLLHGGQAPTLRAVIVHDDQAPATSASDPGVELVTPEFAVGLDQVSAGNLMFYSRRAPWPARP